MIIYGILLLASTLWMLSSIRYEIQNITGFTQIHPILALIWACAICYYFYLTLKKFYSIKVILPFALSLIASILIPYSLQDYPILSDIHILFALIGSIGTVLLYMIICYRSYPKSFYFNISFLFLIGCIFAHYGVINGILEGVVIIYLILLSMYLYKNSMFT